MRVTVVGGAGHVGIPLVLALAKAGHYVNVNDKNLDALRELFIGRAPFMEHGVEDLLRQLQAQLTYSNAPQYIHTNGPVIVTIGTPVDEFMNPVRRVIKDCIDSLLPHMVDGQLLILRSTVYPGTTEWLQRYLQGKKKLLVAFCPERVVQGRGLEELERLPQIVSGTSPEAVEQASQLFLTIAPEVVRMKPIEAELAKLFGNAYRYIQFAAANEFYSIAKAAGADYHALLKGMQHNYPRLKDLPGPGYAAGPCLVKDTMQLAAFASNQFRMGQAAIATNEGLVLQVVEQLGRWFNLKKQVVGLLGMAFKAEIDDTRASLSYKFKKVLAGLAGEVLTTDPYVKGDPDLLPLGDVLWRSDILIVCAPHAEYASVDFMNKKVVDIWNITTSGVRI